MMMIGGCNKNGVNLLPDFVEHLPVISEHLQLARVAVMLFQKPLHIRLLLFIGVHNCNQIVHRLGYEPIYVAAQAPPAAANLHAIQLVPDRSSSGDSRSENACSGDSPSGDSSVSDEIATT